MPEENSYGDISSQESVDGLVVPTTNPFYPNIEFRYTEDGDFEGYKVDFNQGYIFNRVSATQVDDIGDTGICTISQMAQSFELDKEHDKKFYVEASINASNFLIESAIFTGFDAAGDQPSTEFPEIIFADEVEKASYTGYFPVLQLKNGSLLKYTQRNNIFLSDRQFKQLGAEGSATGIENRAQVLVKDGKGAEFNPVRVRAVRGIGGVEVFQEPDYIVISGSTGGAGSEFTGQNIGGGRKVYVDGTTDPAQFRTLTGAENIEISIVGDTVEIKSEDINCTSANWNAYVDGTKNPAQFRGLNFGDGIIVSDGNSCAPTISVDTGCCDLENTTNAGSFTTNNITINSSVDVGTSPLNVVTDTTTHEAITVWCGGSKVQEYKTDSSCNGVIEVNDSSETTVNKLTASSSFGNYFNTHTAIGTTSPNSSYSLYVRGAFKVEDSSNSSDGKIQFGSNTDNTIEIDQSNSEFRLGAGVTKIESAQSDTMHVFSETSADYSAILASLVGGSPSTGSAILGGSGNSISGHFDVIVAGVNNAISGGFYNFIGGGTGIDITGSSYSSSIGGLNNDIFGSDYAIIGGGDSNKIEDSDRSFVGGGTANHIVGGNFSTIGGGQNNIIKDKSSLIGGGESNEIRFQAVNGGYNFIGAGVSNIISGGQSTIAGGNNNIISGSRSVTLGGAYQNIAADDAVTAGNYSKVQPTHDGAFVFSDSSTTPSLSSGTNSMVMDFANGVYVNTDQALYVNGNPVLTGETPEGDTLQTVTNRGNVTTTSIKAAHISGSNLTLGNGVTDASIQLDGDFGGGDLTLQNLGSNQDIFFKVNDGGVTTTPFTIQGSTSNVGIGTDSPSAKLELLGKQMITVGANASPQTEDYLYIGGDGLAGADAAIYIGNRGNGSGYGWRMFYEGTGSDNDNKLKFKSENLGSPVDVITMLQDGKVGIGTTSPDFKLEVVADDSAGVMAVRNAGNARDTFRSENAAGTRTFNIGNDANGHGLVLVRGAGGTTTSQIAGNGDTFFDTDTLYIDHSTNRVGIGITSPSSLLHLSSNSSTYEANGVLSVSGGINAVFNSTERFIFNIDSDNTQTDRTFDIAANRTGSSGGTLLFRVQENGNVGIGTTNPAYKLDVAGNARIGSSSQTTTSLYLTATNLAGSPAMAVQTIMRGYEGRGLGTFYKDDTYSGEEWYCGINYSGGFHRWSVGYDESGGQAEYLANAKFTVFHNGNVGIGTHVPEKNLSIGNAQAEGIQFNYDTTNNYRNQILNYWNSNADSRMDFNIARTSGQTPVTIMSVGYNSNVGIGTTNPSSKLHVGDGTADDFIKVFFSDNTNLDIHGYGIEFNRSVSYLRPTTNANKTLVVGSSTRNFNNINFYSSGVTTFHNANDELVRIDSAGNVGIGTTSPSNVLHVKSTTLNNGAAAKIENTRDGGSDHGLQVTANGTAGSFATRIQQQGAGDILQVLDGSTEVFTILDGGNVGIGTTNPTELLEVDGNIRLGDGGARDIIGPTNESLRILANPNASTEGIIFSTDGGTTTEMFIQDGGNVGIGTTSPNVSIQAESNSSQDKRTLRLAYDSSYYFDIANLGSGGVHYNAVNAGAGGHKFQIDGSEKVRISYAGNVGIGTTSPLGLLQVGKYTVASQGNQGVSGNISSFANSDTNNIFLGLKNGAYPNRGFAFRTVAVGVNSDFTIYEHGQGSAEVFRITAGGNVGIGTTSPFKKLDLGATTSATDIALNYSDSGTNLGQIGFALGSNKLISGDSDGDLVLRNSVSGKSIIFGTQSTERVRIDSSGYVGIGTNNPQAYLDIRGGGAIFSTTLTNNDDWQNSAISILERGVVGTGQSADKYSPNLNFHWTGRVSNSLWMNSSGYLNWGSFGGTGIPNADGVFQTNTINLIGTGRITGVDTVSSGTDATSKTYVDNAITSGIGSYLPLAGGNMTGALNINLSSAGTYFTGGSGSIRQLSITSGTNISAHALHTFNIASVNGKYEFDVNGATELSLDSSSATFAGNLTVSGGGITLGGTGRIQGVDTVTASTDAANKAYVDAQVGSADTLQEVTDNGNTTTNNIGIGTTSPASKLHVAGTASIDTLEYNSIVSVFGQSRIKLNELSDVFYQADKRFTVTGGSPNFFNGNFDSSGNLPTNTTNVINVNVAGQQGVPSNGITYPQGAVYISFYYTNHAYTAISLRHKSNGVYYSSTGTDVSTNSGYKVIKFPISGNNYLTDIEISITTDANLVKVAGINYLADRWNTQLELPYVSKYLTSNTVFGEFGISGTSGSAGPHLKLEGTYTTWELENQYTGGATNDMFRIRNTQLGSDALVIHRGNNNVGIGTTSPVSKLHVYQNDTATSTTAGITIEQDGTGDAQLQFLLSSAYRWVQGIDNSDGDKFKIGRGNAWSIGEDVTITTSGNVGIGTTEPSQTLHVKGIGMIEDASSTSFGTLQFGTNTTRYIRGNSAEIQFGSTIQQLHFQKTNGPAQVASSAADGTTAIQLLARNAHTSANILEVVNGNGQAADFVIDSDGKVGIGTTSPHSSSKLHVNGQIRAGAGATFTQAGSSAAVVAARSFGYGQYSPQMNGSLTVVNTNTAGTAGFISLAAHYGNTNNTIYSAAGIGGGKETTVGDGNWGGYLNFFTTSDGSAGAASGAFEHMRITADGNVGIGTTAPANKLEIKGAGSSTDVLNLNKGTGSGGIKFTFDGTNFVSYIRTYEATAVADNYMALGVSNGNNTTGLEVMRLKGDGKVGIGTTDPNDILEVKSSMSIIDSNGTNAHCQLFSNASEGVLRIHNGVNYGLIARGSANNPYLGAYYGGSLNIVGFGSSDGATIDDQLAVFDFGNSQFKLYDSKQLVIGDGADLRMLHDGSNSVISNYTGDLQIINNADDKDIIFYSDNGSGGLAEYFRLDGSSTGLTVSAPQGMVFFDNIKAKFGNNDDLQIYHNGSNSYVVNNTGDLEIINNTNDGDIIFKSDDGSGGVTPYLRLDGSHTQMLATKNLHFDDNVKALFGGYASPDLQIYHDGSDSIIHDSGTGNLKIRATNFRVLNAAGTQNTISHNDGGDVKLYYAGVQKLATTTSGVSVTGSMLANAAVVNQVTAATSSGSIKFKNNSGSDEAIILDNGNFGIGTVSPAGKLQVYTSANRHTTILGSTADLEVVSDNNTNPVALIKGTGTADLLNVFDNTTEVFTILDGGNVGIGTTNPTATLDIKGDGAEIFLKSADYSVARIIPRGTGSNLDKGLLSLFDTGTEDVRIDTAGNSWFNGGNVGIGTTNPAAKLHAYNSAGGDATDKAGMLSEAVMKLQPHASNSTNMLFAQVNSGNGIGIQVTNGPATANWDIALSPFGGNVGIGTTSPAYKLDVDGDTRISGDLIVSGNISGQLTKKISGDGTTTTFTVTHNFGTPLVMTQLLDYGDNGTGATYEVVNACIQRSSDNAIDVLFGSAPSSSEDYLVLITKMPAIS